MGFKELVQINEKGIFGLKMEEQMNNLSFYKLILKLFINRTM